MPFVPENASACVHGTSLPILIRAPCAATKTTPAAIVPGSSWPIGVGDVSERIVMPLMPREARLIAPV